MNSSHITPYAFLRIYLVAILILCCWRPIALQAQQGQMYELRSIEYLIDGDIRSSAINLRLEQFMIGNQYPNRQDFDASIDEQIRILNNLRQLESAAITYTLTPSDTKIFADVTITAAESGNFIILPRPTYSTDDGGELGIRIRDYNFFGTLEQADIAVDVLLPNDGRYKLFLKPSVLIPFQLANLDWYWKSELGFEAPLANRIEDISIVFDNAIGIYFPVLQHQWNVEFAQGVEVSLDPADDLYFLRSKIAFGAEFSTAIINDVLGRLRYRPVISAQVRYRFEHEVRDEDRGVNFSYDHTLGFERIAWEQNLREGLAFTLINNNTYNTFKNHITTDVGVEFIGHFAHNALGISGRLGGRYYFRMLSGASQITEVGEYGRGILNSRAKGNVFIYENFDIRLANFKNRSALEAQGGIFFDTIIAFDSALPFDIDKHLHLGVGVEAIGYFLNSRSIFLRFAVGLDPLISIRTKSIFGDNNLEIFFGIGHHY